MSLYFLSQISRLFLLCTGMYKSLHSKLISSEITLLWWYKQFSIVDLWFVILSLRPFQPIKQAISWCPVSLESHWFSVPICTDWPSVFYRKRLGNFFLWLPVLPETRNQVQHFAPKLVTVVQKAFLKFGWKHILAFLEITILWGTNFLLTYYLKLGTKKKLFLPKTCDK